MVKCPQCKESMVQTGQAKSRSNAVVTHTYHKCTNDYCTSYGVPMTHRLANNETTLGLPQHI